jgi:hypothetical protein
VKFMSKVSTIVLVLFFVSTGILSHAQTEADAQDDAATTPLPAMLVTSVTAGFIDPAGKVPAINGVPGSKISNADLPFPLGLLVHGHQYIYTLSAQDNNYTGSCTGAYSLTQVQDGKTVTLGSGNIKAFNTKPGDVWLWDIIGSVIPDAPGLAKLTGSFTCGTTTNSLSSTMILQ